MVPGDEEDDMVVEVVEDDTISDLEEGKVPEFMWLCIGKRTTPLLFTYIK